MLIYCLPSPHGRMPLYQQVLGSMTIPRHSILFLCLQSNGGGWVPLSRAICCRPCLPKEIPGTTEATAVAIISTGCHPSSNRGPDVLQCESSGGSFITGELCLCHSPVSLQAFYTHLADPCYGLAFLQDKTHFCKQCWVLPKPDWYCMWNYKVENLIITR